MDWVGTKDQMADILTKVLPGPATKTFRSKLHLRDCPDPKSEVFVCGGVLDFCV